MSKYLRNISLRTQGHIYQWNSFISFYTQSVSKAKYPLSNVCKYYKNNQILIEKAIVKAVYHLWTQHFVHVIAHLNMYQPQTWVNQMVLRSEKQLLETVGKWLHM